MKFNRIWPLVLLVGLGAGCAPAKPVNDDGVPPVAVQPSVDPYAGWGTITPGGVVSMRIPPNCHGDGAAGSTFVVCPTDKNPSPTPDMQISSDGIVVAVHRWEGLSWEYRDQVIASMRVVTPLTHTVTITIDK